MKTECVEYRKADGKYYRIDHPSGVTLFYYPTPGKNKSAAMIATKFGSINREFKKHLSNEWMTVPDGIAHFLEHKLFESPKGNAFDYYAKTGAKANAYTSNDRTAYYFIATDKFYESLDILLRFVKHPYFTKENVDKEKGIIGQEIRMYDDEPSWQGYLALTKALYVNHPVRLDIAGTVETISGIDDTMLYDCYNVFYNNSNLCLCIAGDLEIDKILEVCDRQLPKETSEKIKQHIPDEPEQICQKRMECEMDISRPQFFIGIKDNDVSQSGKQSAKHEICVEILIASLFGEASAFYKKLYQSGVINSEFAVDYEGGVGYGFVLFSGESEKFDEILSEVEQICDTFDKTGIGKDDFILARNTMYGDMIRTLDNAQSIVNQFVSARLQDCDVFSGLRALKTVSIDDVIQTGKNLLNKEHIAISVVNPKRK